MTTRCDPWRVAEKLMERSRCRVKMAAVLIDRRGAVFAWGWNSAGPDGLGLCAERHALGRANPGRLAGAAIAVRGRHARTESASTPCPVCLKALAKAGVAAVIHRGPDKRRRTTPLKDLRTHRPAG